MDSIPKEMKKPREAIFIQPCEMKPSEKMLIKPCEKIPTEKTAGTMLIKPCETISERSTKKRRVLPMPREVEDPEEVGEVEEELEVAAINIKKGDYVDVKALLSSKVRNFLVTTKGGEVVPIANLDGKYALVCCFIVPFDMESPEVSLCQSIEALYSELYLKGIADSITLVVVAKITPGSGSDEAEFDSFCSRLSVNCLTIPFSDAKSCDKVCKSLGLSTQSNSGDVACLALHPNGNVLQHDPCFFRRYGAESFPFTKEHFNYIEREDKAIKNSLRSGDCPIPLEKLLRCDCLSRIANESNSIPTSDLRDTLCALYLCYDGLFMVKLQDIHQQCVEKGLKFEVIIVPLPFDRHFETPSFYDLIKQAALGHSASSSWLVFPFNDKICRTLWRLFHCYSEDQLIILPHGQCLGDLWGRHIATSYGIDAYPFTRDVIIEKNVSELKSFTLEPLLISTHMSDLVGKNIILYLDYPTFDYDNKALYKVLEQNYREIKVKHPDSELVFVPLGSSLAFKSNRIAEMKWHILPQEMCESVMELIYGNGCVYPTLVTFGKDGKILSRTAWRRVPVSASSASLFDDTLASEVVSEIEEEMY